MLSHKKLNFGLSTPKNILYTCAHISSNKMNEQTKKIKKSYDTRVKYLVRQGLLPDIYRKQIHRSLLSKWRREAPDKYVGYELNDINSTELYEVFKKVGEDQKMQRALFTFYRTIKTLKDIIGTGKEYVNTLSKHKHRVVKIVQSSKGNYGVKKAIKIFGISVSTFRIWAMEVHFKCGQSLTKLCSNAYPQQLTPKEVRKMHRLLSDEKYLHWPIISVAYYCMKKGILKAHPNTWYKYARLMEMKRKRFRKFKVKYDVGLRANAPNEKWHADITELRTADGIKSYIYLVVDNFSRYIISWRVSDRICAKTRLDTFREAIEKAGLLPEQTDTTQLIVDGGTENNNKTVERFIDKYPVDKVVALQDIEKSNSMVEALNRLLKYSYLFTRNLMNQTELTNAMHKYVIPDYNNRRPHGSLHGLTPQEAYGQVQVDFKGIRIKMERAHLDRINYNQTHSCLSCFHGCRK